MQRSTDSGRVANRPFLADVGVIGLVPDVWASPWQPRHQVLTHLAGYFTVVWVDPARGWRELWLHPSPPKKDGDPEETKMSGFTVYQPGRWLPLLYSPRFLADLTARIRLRRARRILLKQGCRKTILYLWRPEYEPALGQVSHDLSCYHIDDEYTFSEVEKPLQKSEASLISLVDQVFIHSPALMEKKGHLNLHTASVPNGVDYQAYATPASEPQDLAPIARPRIGYVGIIKKQLDLGLLITLAERHREWSFVFVGPLGYLGECAPVLQKLSQLPNVYFLGGKPVRSLPAYTQHLDVCMLCYAINNYTKFIYPLKLHEYLASGRPVVGSPIRTLKEFAHVIKLAHTADEWSSVLTEALSSAACSVAQVEARRAVARQHDWGRIVRLIARTLCKRLGPTYSDRFEKILVQNSKSGLEESPGSEGS